MWNKFLLAYRGQCKTHAKLTAIHFPISYTPRREWSEAQRYEELGLYYLKILDPVFLEKIRGMIRDYYRIEHENFLNHPRDFVPAVTKKIAGLLRRSLDR